MRVSETELWLPGLRPGSVILRWAKEAGATWDWTSLPDFLTLVGLYQSMNSSKRYNL